ncbi:oxygen-independent coproporphyrinogen III oxidase [Tianweitania sp. BSSL-BM11]|uniref:Coproporphyrinogen-III oxidase n=1 Tax=Tianweitania aestuarii TaxID=2814886 RepID=A0ABS5RWY0_9HYPH|nr:oxygen-independent coproporphyrinogen III oxidase [Tianweitania aestuarii]MBS9721581.1 oxygen-independent coproporphyrinogen III oxidase [Tianweitania aestuarii]
MTANLIARYAGPVPRYTSYPTAPHFHDGITQQTYARWLGAIDPNEPISLYLHLPFCDRLCWFCGCNTKQVRRYDPIAAYLDALNMEIATVARHLGRAQPVVAIHFGGGSPTMIEPADLARLRATLDAHFTVLPGCEISVEVDPNDITQARLDAWGAFGATRASFGVQDFDLKVQQSINRLQSFEQTREALDGFRQRGVQSANLDVLYGLPHQTEETLAATIRQVISLHPDRIALFGYAHVPWMKKHQTMIDEAALPNKTERFAQAALGARLLTEAGYVQVGIDHFALPGDRMAKAALDGTLRRNFQGYTTDTANVLIGLGASAIGSLEQGYIQSITATAQYSQLALAGELPVARGFALSDSDKARRWIIEFLMCGFAFDVAELRKLFPQHAEPLLRQAASFVAADPDDLVRMDGERFTVTQQGRPFVRVVASWFDDYLARGAARHSAAV